LELLVKNTNSGGCGRKLRGTPTRAEKQPLLVYWLLAFYKARLIALLIGSPYRQRAPALQHFLNG
jgi:hypothetical protein